MTCVTKNKVIIYSSFILYMIDNMLDDNDKSKGSVIRLRQTLAAKTVSKEHYEIAKLSNEVWAETNSYFGNKKMRTVIGDMIEQLVFDEEKAFTEFYSVSILNIVGTVSVKVTDSGVDKEIYKESREVVKKLIELTRKKVWHYCKEK